MANKTISKISLQASENRDNYIQELARAGYALFPMSGFTSVPGVVDWPDAPYDQFATGDDFKNCNYGIALKDDDLVIDVDPRNFVPGDNPLERLALSLGVEKFETYTVVTGGGGLHIYLKKPKGIPIRKKHKSFPGIDFLSYGSFTVGPGSIHHKNKKPYFVSEGSPDKMLEADPRLVKALERLSSANHVGISEVTDDEATRERFISWLRVDEGAMQGDNGDQKTYDVACVGRDFGLSEEATFELMLEWWNDSCSPPWTPADLAKKVSNAYKYARSEIGNRHPEADFEPLEDDDTPTGATSAEPKAVDPELLYAADQAAAEQSVQWNFTEGKNGRQTIKPDILNISNHFAIPDVGQYTNPMGGIIKYNAFSKMVDFVKPAPWHAHIGNSDNWTKMDTIMFKTFLCKKRGWNAGTELVYEAMLAYAKTNPYHPIRDYLAGLEWDGVPRLDKLFIDYAGAPDNDYTRAVSRCTLLAAVARVMVPGIQHDYIPIMEGKQETGKSSFVRILGGDWYAGFGIDVNRLKDTIVKMIGAWIIEIPEFICGRQADENELKSFITTTADVERLPYDKDKSVIKRESIFISTFNPRNGIGYFKDPTGNRRFWPVETGTIRLDELAQDRDQLFAEAYYRFFLGEAHWITDKRVRDMAKAMQADRTEGEAWAMYIQSWLEKEASRGMEYPTLSTEFIAQDILNLTVKESTKSAFNRIAQAMDELGWVKDRVVFGGRRLRGYRSPMYPGVGPAFDAKMELDHLLDGV